MNAWTFSVVYNEAKILPYFLRHYETFCDRMVFWVDEASNDGTREMIMAHPKAEFRPWPHKTGLDDEQFIKTANHWPSFDGVNHHCDWVAFVDADELLYHPEPERALREEKSDAIPARGYALISATGWPLDDGRQIYDQVPTGTYQDNYSKTLWHRPQCAIGHSHGRHEVHRFDGKIGELSDWRLFHCHHVGGADDTKQRNLRNIDRANDKRFAWAYMPDQEEKGSGGTERWVLDSIKNNSLFNVLKAKQ